MTGSKDSKLLPRYVQRYLPVYLSAAVAGTVIDAALHLHIAAFITQLTTIGVFAERARRAQADEKKTEPQLPDRSA
jgi:hypothetical protein